MENSTRPRRLFLDNDGVLADFDKLANVILGMPAPQFEEKYHAGRMWSRLFAYNSPEGWGFFEALEMMPDARQLVDAVAHLKPTILTGAPSNKQAMPQKMAWRDRNLPNMPMIVCMAKDKVLHMEAGDVLIDDREKHRATWENAGGVWITHTSAESSLRQLRDLVPEWF